MGKIKEFVAFRFHTEDLGNEEEMFIIEREEEDLVGKAQGGRPLEHVKPFEEIQGIIGKQQGARPKVIYANEDIRIEVSNQQGPQWAYHRGDSDELTIQILGTRTVRTEVGEATVKPGEFALIPRGVAHRNLCPDEPNQQVIIFTRRPLKRIR